MPSGAKIGMAVAVLGDHLFVVGGFDDSRRRGDRIVSDVERYNIATDRQRFALYFYFIGSKLCNKKMYRIMRRNAEAVYARAKKTARLNDFKSVKI
jgi:hypothetical protein